MNRPKSATSNLQVPFHDASSPPPTVVGGGSLSFNDVTEKVEVFTTEGWVQTGPRRIELAAAPTINNAITTMQVVPGLVWVGKPGTSWVDIYLDVSVNGTSASLSVALSCVTGASFARCSLGATNVTNVTTVTWGTQIANVLAGAAGSAGAAAGVRAASATRLPLRLTGTITLSASSQLQVLISRSALTLTVNAGSGGILI